MSREMGTETGTETGKVSCDMAVSLDGYVAGPHQSLDQPFGEGVDGRLHRWMFDEPERHAAVIEGITEAGAFIMGLESG
ncbi:MAG TPA: hypothetical protein VFV66_27030 [Nonomuraea sp.]|nr:hypothetical protein [Nonomuraea sp.]